MVVADMFDFNYWNGAYPCVAISIQSVTYPDNLSETFEYDKLGNLTNHIDRAGRVSKSIYAPTRKLTSATRGTGAEESTISFDYDQQFNTLNIKDALDRKVESYQLDIQDRPVTITNIDNQVMSISYGVGNMIKLIERFDGTTVSNQYDTSARLTAIIYPDATNTITYYDNALLKTIGNGSGTISNKYDGANRLLSQSFMSFMPFMVSYLLDPVGNATNITVTINSSTTLTNSYTFDAAERVSEINGTGGTFTHAYNQYNGLISAVTNTTSGIHASYQFDDMDRLTNIVWRKSNNTILRSFEYAYNNAGMITNITRETAAESTAYNYDSLDRLIAATSAAHTNSYGWDLAGNPTSRIENAVTTTYTLGTGNQLDSWTGGSYKYNYAGCITNITHGSDILALTWDSQYQLTSINTTGAVAETYGYDSLGRRTCSVRSQSGTSTTNYYVYNGIHCIADVNTNGNLIRSYQYGTGIDNVLAMTVYTGTVAKTYYALTDHLGTVHAMADIGGYIIEIYKYDAQGRVLGIYDNYGNPLTESAIGNRYLWQGREYSFATEAYFFRSRYYDPTTGRWLSKDRIGISGGVNLYEFCNNNGVNFVDPLGLAMTFIYGKGHAWVETDKGGNKGTWGFAAAQYAYDYYVDNPNSLGATLNALFNEGVLNHPDRHTQYSRDDSCTIGTTPEMEDKLVKEMHEWATEHNYVGWVSDCRDFTEHFQQRAKDLMEVERVKNRQMGLGAHVGSRLRRHLLPNKHNRL